MNKMSSKIFFFIILILSSTHAYSEDKLAIDNLLAISAQDVVLGKQNAPNTVIEYISPSCFHCATFHLSVFPEIKKTYIDTGSVKWVTRIYVNDAPSLNIAMLAKCDSNKKFYPLLNLYLSNQSAWTTGNKPLNIIENIFLLAGNSKSSFNECTNNKIIENEIIDTRKNAANILKLLGTPAFYINGKQSNIANALQFKSLLK